MDNTERNMKRLIFLLPLYFIPYLAIQLFVQLSLHGDQETSKSFLYFAGIALFLTIIIAASFHYAKVRLGILIVLLNGVVSALAIHAYILHIDQSVDVSLLLQAGSIPIAAMVVFLLLYQIPLKNTKLLYGGLIILGVALIALIIVWIATSNKAFWSEVFFASLMLVFYLGFYLFYVDGNFTFSSAMTYASFGSLMIFIVILMILSESGDFLEGFFTGGGSRQKKTKL